MEATATRSKKRAVKKKNVATRRAPKSKRPDPEQKRLVDQTTGQPIDMVYRNEQVDQAFVRYRRVELSAKEKAEAFKKTSEDLKTPEEIKLENRLKKLKEQIKPLIDERKDKKAFQEAQAEMLSMEEKRKQQKEKLKGTLVVEQPEIEKNNNGNPYVCIDHNHECFYVGLVEGEVVLSIRQAKVKEMTED